jgi:dihydrofolate synthase/folylpolyglutamate synthase
MITSISFDHQQQLGDTLAKIASEKAGIIKDEVPVIHGVRAEEARDVIRCVSKSHGSDLWEIGVDFDAQITPNPPPSKSQLEFLRLTNRVLSPSVTNYQLGMLGRHQGDNAALVIAAWQRLIADGWALAPTAVQQSLAETQVPARVEIIQTSPTIIIDSAHNEASIDALLDTLHSYFDVDRRTIIFACSKDKKYREMLRKILPKCDRLILTQYHSNPRFVPVERLEALASELKSVPPRSNAPGSSTGSETELFSAPNIDEAIRFATQHTSKNELLCITGSFFIASEARLRLLKS